MNILLADADPTLRMSIKELPEISTNSEITEASDAAEAWTLLDTGPQFDLCILDPQTPDSGGLELVNKLRADGRFALQKVMVCSAVNDRAQVVNAMSLGIDGYVLKPFAADTLRRNVRRILGRPSMPRLPALEPLNEALARLGTKKETYIRLLKTFSGDVLDTIGLLKTNWTADVRELALARLNSIQDSGNSLGAGALARRAAFLGQHVATNDTRSKSVNIAALEVENCRVIQAVERIETGKVVKPAPAFTRDDAGQVPYSAGERQGQEPFTPSIDFMRGNGSRN